MREEFLQHIRNNKLFTCEETILLAVSGGIDSMVMTDLFLKAGLKISIGHVNHNLRGEESLEDADFVRKFCRSNGIRFHYKELDSHALDKGNMQSNARQARYLFFEQIADEFGYNKIATAHNQDDNIETFFINSLRGTGINGLDGIPIKRDRIIRPMLFASRTKIENYTANHSISYREDASNQSLKYTRNKVRHQVISSIKQIDPQQGKGIIQTIQNLKQDNELLTFLIGEAAKKWKTTQNHLTIINVQQIKNTGHGHSIVRHLLIAYGYNAAQTEEIMEQSDKSGLLFYSSTHELLIDRGNLLIRKIQKKVQPFTPLAITQLPYINNIYNKCISLELIDYFDGLDISGPELFLDFEKLTFPLVLRLWNPGDLFQPFGMTGKQKVKAYLTNKKIDRFNKAETLILADQNGIAAIIGHRISHHVKVEHSTKKVIRIQVSPSITSL